MEAQPNTAKYPTAIDYIERLTIILPCPLAIFSLYSAQQYDSVVRSTTMFPIAGVPTTIFYVSLLICVCYAAVLFTFSRSEINRFPQFGSLALLSTLSMSLCFCGIVVALNGALDTSAPQEHQAKVLGTYQFRKMSYAKVQDWRDPDGFVLFRNPNDFLEYYPVGSTVSVLTKSGKFGYEYVVDEPKAQSIQP